MPGGPRRAAICIADLRLTLASERWADQYALQVGQSEVLAHAPRHHYFLGKVRGFLARYRGGVFINIGSGFTNYPHLLPAEMAYCELDTEARLCYKQEKRAELERTQQLPPLSNEFIAISDLNDPLETGTASPSA